MASISNATSVETGTRGRRRGALLVALVLCAVVPAATAVAFRLGPSTTVRVSVSSAGVAGDADSSQPAVSADGRYVAFHSGAANLVPGDTNGVSDVFVRDLQSGATTRVSVSSAGVQGDDWSGGTSISADGRYVAYTSGASNLVPGDGNGGPDVFVHDRHLRVTTRVSVSSAGNEADHPSFFEVAISANGRCVAFESSATNLAPGDTNDLDDVFVHDRLSGKTTRVSVSSAGVESDGEGYTYAIAISADGRYVAFESRATTLVPGDTNGVYDVFVHDRQTAKTTRVSVSSAGVEGTAESRSPTISADGRYVAFLSEANNLVPGDTGGYDVYVHDLQNGQTTRVSVSSAGAQGDGASGEPAISAYGRYVAFESRATNLVSGDANGARDVFVRDRQTAETTRVSVSSAGAEGDGDGGLCAISADGRYVAFESLATNLVAGDADGVRDIFIRDCMKAGSVITVTSASATLAKYGDAYTMVGSLESDGTPLVGQIVALQTAARSTGPWTTTTVVATTEADGGFSLRHVPRAKTYYRARFAGVGLDYEASFGAVRSALPRAWLSAPVAPSTMHANEARSVWGYLKPRHAAGTFPVRIYEYRYVSGTWRSYGSVKAKASNYSGYTKYTGSVKLPYSGKWRLRAYQPADSRHAASWSAKYDYVTVR